MLEKLIELRLRVCPDCGAADTGSGWGLPGEAVEKGRLQVAREMIAAGVRTPPPGELIELEVTPRGSDEHQMNFVVRARVEVCGETVEKEGRARVRVRSALCDSCSRAAGSYYEATLQLRARERKPEPDEVQKFFDVVYDIVDKQRLRGDGNSFVTDVITLKEGIDIRLGSSKVARRIATEVSRAFGAETLETSSLVGQKDGRDVYRISISIRLPRFRVGDVVIAGRKVLVVQATGRQLKGYLLPSHQPERVESNDAKPVGNTGEARNGVVVTAGSEGVQVVEPWGNRCVLLKSPGTTRLDDGAEVPLLRIGDDMFILRGEPADGLGS